jgi:hypothetical protein
VVGTLLHAPSQPHTPLRPPPPPLLPRPPAPTHYATPQELFGFQRVFVPAGQTVTVFLGVQVRRDRSRTCGSGPVCSTCARLSHHPLMRPSTPPPLQARDLAAVVGLTAAEEAAAPRRTAGEVRARRVAVPGEYVLRIGVQGQGQAWSETRFTAVSADSE